MESRAQLAVRITTALLICGLCLCPLAAVAQPGGQQAGSWSVRAFGSWLDTAGDTLGPGQRIDPLPPIVEPSLTIDSGTGAGLALEYRATRRLGVEALALFADLDADARLRPIEPPGPPAEQTQDLSTDLLGVGLNIHLTPGRRVDIYAGPLVALVRYDEVTFVFDGGEHVLSTDFDDDTAFGVTLGMDIALDRAGAWALTSSLRQLWSSTEVEGTNQELDIDPLIASLGIAYRWGGR